jgi:hypothetical protein
MFPVQQSKETYMKPGSLLLCVEEGVYRLVVEGRSVYTYLLQARRLSRTSRAVGLLPFRNVYNPLAEGRGVYACLDSPIATFSRSNHPLLLSGSFFAYFRTPPVKGVSVPRTALFVDVHSA